MPSGVLPARRPDLLVASRHMAAGAPEVTVVAATHNRSGLLRRLLEGLRAQTISPDRFEVVIVDDGSSDDTPEVLSAAEAAGDLRLRVLRNDPAGGPAVARNRGWRAARAPLVAFTDDDCRPSEAWLERLLAAAAGGRGAHGRTQPDALDADFLGPFAETGGIEEAPLHYETCNILSPRAVLDRLDGFDEAYPAPAGEDTDLGQRSAADGVDRVFSPDALVYHAVHDQSRKQALKGILIA